MVLAFGAIGTTAQGSTCPALPSSFANGDPADATQVMNNFNSLLTCANGSLAPLSNPCFAGNIGIGTTSPLSKLDIYASTPGTPLFDVPRASNLAIKALWLSVDSADSAVFTTSNSNLNFLTNWNGGSPLSTLFLRYDGSVGIGTTTPQGRLRDLKARLARDDRALASLSGTLASIKTQLRALRGARLATR